ncbi:MAG: class I SAM-dependent methyltransferase [Rhizomicrobium sp.]|jgi:SAM-dependent methyltransferase
MGIAAAETIIAWQSHEGPRIARAGGHDIIQCVMCGFRHIVPLPEPRAFEHTYRDVYLRDQTSAIPSRPGDDEAWSEVAHADLLESFERLLGPSRRRLLDIGSGPGFFLKTAKKRGWRVLGIEPSRSASAHSRSLGVEVAEGFFNAETAPGLGRYDAIQLNNVLEHVPYPTETLLLARDLLEPGGVLCVNVPNDFSPFQVAARVAAGLPEWWVAPNRHLNYFDFDSVSDLLVRLDFEPVERTTSFPMEMFLLMGENYTSDPALGRACHAKRRRFDLALEATGMKETRRAFYRALANAGFGREAIVIAVKP